MQVFLQIVAFSLQNDDTIAFSIHNGSIVKYALVFSKLYYCSSVTVVKYDCV